LLEQLYKYHWHISVSREFPNVDTYINELSTENSLSGQQWQNRLMDRLKNLLVYAQQQIPFYQKIFAKVNFDPLTANLPAEMVKIPILTKSVIQKNLPELVGRNINNNDIFENTTGGSTGVPLKFYQDSMYSTIANAIEVKVRTWWGIKPYDKTAIIWGADREFHDLSFKEKIYQWRSRIRAINAFKMNDADLDAFCKMLMKWKPAYLVGYSSALEYLARFALQNGYTGIRFKAIRSSAEMLWPQQREIIEKCFQSPLYNFYGSREVNNLAAECPQQHALHLLSTWRYVEITDEHGQPVPAGSPGQIVVTDLSNYTMPFIRYQNEDSGQFQKDPCPCSRPSPVLEHLLGRSSDLIQSPNGQIIHGEFFTHLFYGNSSIQKFQAHQTDQNTLHIRYVSDNVLAADFLETMKTKIKAKMGNKMQIHFEQCREIPLAKSGKHRFTISDLKIYS